MATAVDVIDHHGDRHCPAIFAAGQLSRLHGVTNTVLAAASALARLLCCSDPSGQDVAAEEKLDLTGNDLGVCDGEGDLVDGSAKQPIHMKKGTRNGDESRSLD